MMHKYDEIIEYFKLAEYHFMNDDYQSAALYIDQAMTLCFDFAPKPSADDRLLGSDFIRKEVETFYNNKSLLSMIKNKQISYKALPIAIFTAYATGFKSGIYPPYDYFRGCDFFRKYGDQYGDITLKIYERRDELRK